MSVLLVQSTSGRVLSYFLASGSVTYHHHHRDLTEGVLFKKKKNWNKLKVRSDHPAIAFGIFYKHHYGSSLWMCHHYPETQRFPKRLALIGPSWRAEEVLLTGSNFKFIQACGSRCTHLVHLHQSWENPRRNPAVKGQMIFSHFHSTPNLFGAVQTNSGGAP